MPTIEERWGNITPEQIQRIFDRIEIDKAFLPYYPEMLDFDLAENLPAERLETTEYFNHFGVNP
jgi:hypothetical protein